MVAGWFMEVVREAERPAPTTHREASHVVRRDLFSSGACEGRRACAHISRPIVTGEERRSASAQVAKNAPEPRQLLRVESHHAEIVSPLHRRGRRQDRDRVAVQRR